MLVLQLFISLVCASTIASAASLPESNALSALEAHGASNPRSNVFSPAHSLEKRKGGGGGGGRGGGGGGKGGGGGGRGGSTPSRTSPGSNVGGATRAGSGPPRAYGGGFYGGGAAVPYGAGKKTPRGLNPGLLLLPAAALLIFPGLWLHGAYPYYLNQYRFYNESYRNATQRGLNQTLPVVCLCEETLSCGCENNNNTQYLNDLVGNGSYSALNKTLVTVADVNGTTSLVINGTLPNGTTAPGGPDDAAGRLHLGQYSGYWLMGLIVLYTAVLL